MFALELGGKEYAWNSTVIIGLFSTVVIMLIIFFFVERKATEPIISFHLFKNLYSQLAKALPFSMVPLLSSVQFIFQSSFKVFSVVQPQMLD